MDRGVANGRMTRLEAVYTSYIVHLSRWMTAARQLTRSNWDLIQKNRTWIPNKGGIYFWRNRRWWYRLYGRARSRCHILMGGHFWLMTSGPWVMPPLRTNSRTVLCHYTTFWPDVSLNRWEDVVVVISFSI